MCGMRFDGGLTYFLCKGLGSKYLGLAGCSACGIFSVLLSWWERTIDGTKTSEHT